MRIPLTYGALMALGTALLTLLLYFAGMHDTPEKMQASSWVGMVASFAITVLALTLAMREKRAILSPESTWSYSRAAAVGVLTALVGAILSGLFAYVYFAFLNPDAVETMVQMQIAAMESKGLSPAQIDRAEPMLRRWMSPGLLTSVQTFMAILWTIVLSLIVAIFLRQDLRSESEPAG